jgi:hypothetical protein
VDKTRILFAAFLALWLAVGPVASGWAAYASTPCESMSGMSAPVPGDDCCGDRMDPATCLSACMAVSPAAASPVLDVSRADSTNTEIPSRSFRYVTIVAPPDIAPPKSFVS